MAQTFQKPMKNGKLFGNIILLCLLGESHVNHATSNQAKNRRKSPYTACHTFSSHW